MLPKKSKKEYKGYLEDLKKSPPAVKKAGMNTLQMINFITSNPKYLKIEYGSEEVLEPMLVISILSNEAHDAQFSFTELSETRLKIKLL